MCYIQCINLQNLIHASIFTIFHPSLYFILYFVFNTKSTFSIFLFFPSLLKIFFAVCSPILLYIFPIDVFIRFTKTIYISSSSHIFFKTISFSLPSSSFSSSFLSLDSRRSCDYLSVSFSLLISSLFLLFFSCCSNYCWFLL